AYEGGWYTGRRPIQEAFVVAALALGGVTLLATLILARPARGFRALAVTFAAALCAFVAARAVSLHALDHVLFSDSTAGIQRGALIELCLIAGLVGSGLLDIGVLRWRRRGPGARAAAISRIDGSGSPVS
ncbi:MAG: hypothetical protein ACRDG3_11585, partial [Tepidiformaceae bacterium]